MGTGTDTGSADAIRSADAAAGHAPVADSKTGLLKLNVGCGRHKLPGYVNVDIMGQPDLKADFRLLHQEFDGDTVDEILANHVIEHLYLWDLEPTLNSWRMILKPGGKLIIEAPDLDKILANFASGTPDLYATIFGLYGEQNGNPAMIHKWCYTPVTMTYYLEKAGYVDIISMAPHFHRPDRDFRTEARKAGPCQTQ